MERFQGEDRHNPLPHITLLTTALNSAYRNTASMANHLAPSCGNFGRWADWNGSIGGCPDVLFGTVRLREVFYHAKGGGRLGR